MRAPEPRLQLRTWQLTPDVMPPPPPVVLSKGVLPALPRGRSHPRASLRTEIWLGQDGILTKGAGVLRDLSEGGAFVETPQRFGVGRVLSIRFRLPNPPVFVDGTVRVRHERADKGLGVQFVDLSDENRRRVREFVYRHGVSSN